MALHGGIPESTPISTSSITSTKRFMTIKAKQEPAKKTTSANACVLPRVRLDRKSQLPQPLVVRPRTL